MRGSIRLKLTQIRTSTDPKFFSFESRSDLVQNRQLLLASAAIIRAGAGLSDRSEDLSIAEVLARLAWFSIGINK